MKTTLTFALLAIVALLAPDYVTTGLATGLAVILAIMAFHRE